MILAAITTCRRKPAMVERALRSVIAQTYTDWECVVVDDSPADYEFRGEVRKMVEGYAAQDSRIRYVPHDMNRGVSAARNTALNIAISTDGGGGMSLSPTSTTTMNGCQKNWKSSMRSSWSAKIIPAWFTANVTLSTKTQATEA